MLVGLDVEVLGDSVVEIDELCWTVDVGLEDVDKFGDCVDGVGCSVVADVAELLGVAGEALADSGFCVGIGSVVGDV